MAKEYGRSARVASQIQRELALILHRGINDPRLGFVTVNEVELSKDLAVAKIYITVLNADTQARLDNVVWLNEKTPYIRHELGMKMRIRHVPELRFFYDDSFETGIRVAELLSSVEDNKGE